MANLYQVTRELGADNKTHHNNKWAVSKTPAHSSTGKSIFVAAGAKAQERAEYVAALFQRERLPNEERFLQRLLSGDKAADAELRAIVGAAPRARA